MPRFSWGGAGKGAAAGAGTGAIVGSAIPGVGTAIGAGAGALGLGLLGGFAGGQQDEADDARRRTIDMAMAEQERMRRDLKDQRQRDLDSTLGLYGPALQALEDLYGIPMSAWGPALAQNRPSNPTRTGILPNGQQVTAAPMRPDFLQQMPGARNRLGSAIKPIQGLRSMGQRRPAFQGMSMSGPPAPVAPPPPPRPVLPGVNDWERYR